MFVTVEMELLSEEYIIAPLFNMLFDIIHISLIEQYSVTTAESLKKNTATILCKFVCLESCSVLCLSPLLILTKLLVIEFDIEHSDLFKLTIFVLLSNTFEVCFDLFFSEVVELFGEWRCLIDHVLCFLTSLSLKISRC